MTARLGGKGRKWRTAGRHPRPTQRLSKTWAKMGYWGRRSSTAGPNTPFWPDQFSSLDNLTLKLYYLLISWLYEQHSREATGEAQAGDSERGHAAAAGARLRQPEHGRAGRGGRH